MPTVLKMLPPRAIADVIGMSLDFVYTEIRAGELEAIKVGREFRIERAEAVRYLRALHAPVPDAWISID